MTRVRRWPLLWPLCLLSCLSQNAPAPAVRWFDPRPPQSAGEAAMDVQVTAGPFLSQDFVVRTGSFELAIDDSLRWIAAPDRLVAAAFSSGPAMPAGLQVQVLRFEFERAEEIHALIELRCRLGWRVAPVLVRRPATGSEPAALAAAMAKALAAAVSAAAAIGADGRGS